MARQKKSKPPRKQVKKVPVAEQKVTVVFLRCPNCGEEDEKIIYCMNCDTPMKVEKVVERSKDEVVTDVDVVVDRAGDPDDIGDVVSAGSESEDDVDELIESGNLGDIFHGEGGSAGSLGEEESDGLDFDAAVGSLDSDDE